MKNSIIALRSHVLLSLVVFSLAFIALSCIESPLSPVAPSSAIALEGISVLDMTRTFADFLVKDSTLKRNPDGTSVYVTSKSFTPQGIPPIKLQPRPSSQEVGVGVFSVPGLPPTSSSMTIDRMGLSPIEYPGANAIATGIPPPFPSASISIPGDTLNYAAIFDYLAIHSGVLSLQLNNNLPLQLTFQRPIILRNNQFQPFIDTAVIAVFPVGTIDSFSVHSSTAPLNGKIVRSRIKFDSVSFTTQPRSTPFSLKSNHSLSVQLFTGTLSVDSASAVIPAQQVTAINDSVLTVDSLTVIQSAAFTRGTILLRLVNNLGIDVGVNLIVNEMKQHGTSYSLNQMLTAKQTSDINLDFSNISILADPPLRQYGSTVKFSVGITTIDSKGIKKTVTKNDFVRALFIPGDSLVVQTIVGKIKPTVVQVNTGVRSGIHGEDLGNLSAQVTVQGVQLSLKLPITGGFPTDYHLAFIAKNSATNQIDSIQLISGSSSSFPRLIPELGTTQIQLASPAFDGLIGKFFPQVPDSFYVRGTLTMDPPDIFAQPNTVFRIDDTTKIYPSFDLHVPVALGIRNGTMTDVVPFGKQEIPKDFTKAVDRGMLTFYFYNKLPLKIFVHADFLGNYDPRTRKGDTLLSIKLSDTIQPAPVDSYGFTTASSFSRATVSLNGAQMEQFNKSDSLSIRFDISTSNSGQVVKVRDTDFIRIYAKGDITYTVNKP